MLNLWLTAFFFQQLEYISPLALGHPLKNKQQKKQSSLIL